MEKREAEQLADELIAEVAEAWPLSRDTRAVEHNGEHTFVFIVPYNGSNSVFNFNPKGVAIEIIEVVEFLLGERTSDKMRAILIRDHSKRKLIWMLQTAREHFAESIWQLRRITEVEVSNAAVKPFTRDESKQNESISDLINLFSDRLRQRLAGKRAGRPRAFSDFEAQTAILQLGGRPSQRKLAKALNTTTKTVLTWARDKGFNSLAELLDAFHDTRDWLHNSGEKP